MDNMIIQRRLPHYRVPFFNQLKVKTNFTLFVSENPKSISNLEFPVKRIRGFFPFKKRKSLGVLFFSWVLFRYKPKQVVVEFDLNILNIWALLVLKKIFNYQLSLWTHGYSSKTHSFDSTNNLIDRLRKFWYIRADKIFVYESKALSLLKSYVSPKKIFILNNTVDIKHFDLFRKKFDEMESNDLKNQLGINKKFIITFLGDLSARKNPVDLLSIFKDIQKEIQNIALIYIGDGIEKVKVKSIISKQSIKNVYLLGAIEEAELLSKYLFISNLIALPGHVGLVANTAITLKIPIFTIKLGEYVKSHAPEFNYLTHKQNTFIAEDKDSFKQSIIDYLNGELKFDPSSQYLDLSLEKMVINFEKGLNNP